MRYGFPLAAFAALAMGFAAHPAHADAVCGPSYHQTGQESEVQGDTTIVHPVCEPDALNPPAPQTESKPDCTAVEQQAEADRTTIERLQKTSETNQEELAEWTNMSTEAQKDALWAGVEFAMASYAADTEQAAKSVGKLEQQAVEIEKHMVNASNQQTRLKYLVELHDAREAMLPSRILLGSKKMVEAAANADQAWGIARNTMKDEFRVAAKHNEAMQEVLKDPGFRDAFTGDPGEEPALDILSALADLAVNDAVKAMSTVETYSKLTGPTVRAAVFLREATYNATKSILSTTHVLAENDAAGTLLKASGALEKRYKDTIDSLRSCRAGEQ